MMQKNEKILDFRLQLCYYLTRWPVMEKLCAVWGISSAGRALHWQCRGQRFDPAMLHQSRIIRNIFCLNSVLE